MAAPSQTSDDNRAVKADRPTQMPRSGLGYRYGGSPHHLTRAIGQTSRHPCHLA